MDKKAVAEISIPKAFNKRWWDSNRSSKIKGTGTGALLDSWSKVCPADPKKLTTAQITAAREASKLLEKSLKEAQKLCGTGAPDDLAGIKKMLGMLEVYESLLVSTEEAINGFSEKLNRSIEKYNQAKMGLLQVEKDTPDVQRRFEQAQLTAKKPLDEQGKKQLLQSLTRIREDIDKLISNAFQATGEANLFDAEQKLVLDKSRKDKQLRPTFDRYDAVKAGFFEIGDRQNANLSNLLLKVEQFIKDVSGNETVDTTLKFLQNQRMMVDGVAFNEFNYVVDLAKEWLPKLALARKKPESLTPEDLNQLVVLEEILVNATRVARITEGQIARVMKVTAKAAARFETDQSVIKAKNDVETSVKRRLEQRAQMNKVKPVLEQEVFKHLQTAL